MFQGCITALVTPFRNGGLDQGALESLVEHQVESGVDGLVVAGTTGEAPTLSSDEFRQLVSLVVARVRGRIPVIVGTGSYDTRQAVARTRQAAELGAQGVLVVSPYYNRPGERGLRAHFKMVAESSAIPVLLYDIPSRTGVRIGRELATELMEHPRVVGIKDASGSPGHAMDLVANGGTVMAGDDALTLPWMSLGAVGVVSVASNVVPEAMVELVAAAAEGDLDRARQVHYRLLPLFRALFLESNPVPVKALLSLAGRCTAEVRLPLIEAAPPTVDALRRAWQDTAPPLLKTNAAAS